MEVTPHERSWIAVRCLFSHPTRASDSELNLYEERITVWRAGSFKEAYAMADADALVYAAEEDCIFIRSTDAFHLFEKNIRSGAEVWSTMRGSGMTPELYITTFCDTPRDRKTSGEIDTAVVDETTSRKAAEREDERERLRYELAKELYLSLRSKFEPDKGSTTPQ